MKKYLRSAAFAVCLVLCMYLCSCGETMSALDAAHIVSSHFGFKYGAVYSDEYDVLHEFCFSDEMKKQILGENALKYTYIKSVSGYFSRDMVSGEEFIVIELYDRSRRAEITSALFKRAAIKSDIETRVACKGKLIFFICSDKAKEIERYLFEICP
jgi:hypothetical protein